MKAGRLFALCIVVLLISGCVGTGGSPTDGDDGNTTASGPPAPYDDAEVAFVVDGEERGRLDVQIADGYRERIRGLQNRESVPEGTGMLFVYGDEEVRQFWMRDTLVPLDIIFVDGGRRVVSIEHASPGFEGARNCANPDYYCSEGPARYVVEAERGYANRTGVSQGDELVIRR